MEDTVSLGADECGRGYRFDYTFANVQRCAQGFANYLLSKGRGDGEVVVGYDQRFAAEHFGQAAAEGHGGQWLPRLVDGCGHPDANYLVLNRGAGGGGWHQHHRQPQSALGLWLQSAR